jgi:hypothetical protein
MPGHFTDFLNGGNRSPGILIVPQGAPVGRLAGPITYPGISSTPIKAADGDVFWINIIRRYRFAGFRIEDTELNSPVTR